MASEKLRSQNFLTVSYKLPGGLLKSILILMIFIVPAFGHTTAQLTKAVVTSSVGPQISVIKDGSGNLAYAIPGPDGKLQVVNFSFFETGLKSAIEAAYKIVCELKVLPTSFTVSSVVVSVTYETQQFCRGKPDQSKTGK